MGFETGDRVRLHPLIGGRHDGNVYRIIRIGKWHGADVAWLDGLAASVDLRALSPYQGFGPKLENAGCKPHVPI